jgi:hypothetical protein
MIMGFSGCSEKQWYYHVKGSCHGDSHWCPYCYIEKLTELVEDKDALRELQQQAMATGEAQSYMRKTFWRETPFIAEKIRNKMPPAVRPAK